MAGRAFVDFRGFTEAEAALARLEGTIRASTPKAAQGAADVIRDVWRGVLLPHSHTFRYFISIDDEMVGDRKAVVYASAVRPGRKRSDGSIGPAAPYPRYVEFGTRFMAPRGYGRRAFEMSKDMAITRAGKTWEDGITAAFPGTGVGSLTNPK